VWLLIYLYVHSFTSIPVCNCAYVLICTIIYIYTKYILNWNHINMYVHMYIDVRVNIYIFRTHKCTYKYIHFLHTYMNRNLHVYRHNCTYMYIRVFTFVTHRRSLHLSCPRAKWGSETASNVSHAYTFFCTNFASIFLSIRDLIGSPSGKMRSRNFYEIVTQKNVNTRKIALRSKKKNVNTRMIAFFFETASTCMHICT